MSLSLKEAYGIINNSVNPEQSIFLKTEVVWYKGQYSQTDPTTKFGISIVPGFGSSECSQWESETSLQHAVDAFLLTVKENISPKSQLESAETLLTEVHNIGNTNR